MKIKPIANSWNDMPLGVWQKEQAILREKDTDAVDKNVRLVSLMYGISEVDAYNTELNKFSDMLDGIGWLSSQPSVPNVAPAYNLNGNPYIVTLNPQKITTAQYIDYKSFDPDDPATIHLILSTVMIPSGHTYNDGYDMEKVQQDILEYLRVPHALAIVRFFFQYYKRLTLNSLHSLTQLLKKEARKTKDREKKNQIMIQIKRTEELERTFGSL